MWSRRSCLGSSPARSSAWALCWPTLVGTDSTLGFGLTRWLAGIAFSLGLILVVIAGAELFTGNNLMVMAVASRQVTAARFAPHVADRLRR